MILGLGTCPFFLDCEHHQHSPICWRLYSHFCWGAEKSGYLHILSYIYNFLTKPCDSSKKNNPFLLKIQGAKAPVALSHDKRWSSLPDCLPERVLSSSPGGWWRSQGGKAPPSYGLDERPPFTTDISYVYIYIYIYHIRYIYRKSSCLGC